MRQATLHLEMFILLESCKQSASPYCRTICTMYVSCMPIATQPRSHPGLVSFKMLLFYSTATLRLNGPMDLFHLVHASLAWHKVLSSQFLLFFFFNSLLAGSFSPLFTLSHLEAYCLQSASWSVIDEAMQLEGARSLELTGSIHVQCLAV